MNFKLEVQLTPALWQIICIFVQKIFACKSQYQSHYIMTLASMELDCFNINSMLGYKSFTKKWKLTNIWTSTGCLVSKRDNVSSIYRVFELKMWKIKLICMFIGNGHLTIGPWIWLKVTSLSSTASVLKACQKSIK